MLVCNYTVMQGCPDLAGSRPKNLCPKTTKGPNSKIFKFNHSLDIVYCILLKFANEFITGDGTYNVN